MSEAMVADKPRIQGANYSAIDTQDGFFIVRDVLIMAPVEKGVKGAPENIGADWMNVAVSFSQKEYQRGHFCIPVHKGHHKALELDDPEFLGFAVPKRVGKFMLGDTEAEVVFADFKLKASAFQRAKGGELPYVSPEIDWKSGSFTSISMLDSKPPFFHFPLFTVGSITVDPLAKFEAAVDAAQFAGDKGKEGVCPHCKGTGKLACHSINSPAEVAKMEAEKKDPVESKQAPLPVEPNTKVVPEDSKAKMQADVQEAAKFEALNARIKSLEDQEVARKADAEKKDRVDKAMAELKGFIVSDSLRATMSKFSGDPEAMKALVEELKKSLPKEPPATMSDVRGVAVEANDPVLAKFAQKGPEVLESASRALASYREMKRRGWPVSCNEEQFIMVNLGK